MANSSLRAPTEGMTASVGEALRPAAVAAFAAMACGCSVLYDIDSQAVDPRPFCENAIFAEDFSDSRSLALVERGIYDFTESGGFESSGGLVITFNETAETVKVNVSAEKAAELQVGRDYVFSLRVQCPPEASLLLAAREVLDADTDAYHQKLIPETACDGEQFWLSPNGFTAELDERNEVELQVSWRTSATPPTTPLNVTVDNYCLQPL